VLIPDQPLTLFEQGNFYRVPIIIGNVRNESNVFGYLLQSALNINKLSAFEYESLVLLFFQKHASAILHAYPAMSDSFSALFRLTSDYIFLCPSRLLAVYAARVVPVRWYQYLLSTIDDPITPYEHLCFVNQTVCHAAEVSYVFHSVDNYPGFRFSQSESEFSLSLLRVWASFANASLSEQFWPLFDNTTLLSMQFDLQSSIASGYHASNCDLWDKIGYDW
jgi:para-nitrobenzyl esterase